jgi:hypothetical protein
VLSPFQVDATKEQGYFAQNTLAGSRMRMNLSDLGAAISVVTKQQMEDTASVDINDVFRYEVNTEGSLTYTPATATFRSDGVLDVNAGGTQGNSLGNFTNSTANRVRGLGTPSMAINYYPSIAQIPLDSYNVQSLEISRGPNSMIFGLGSPAGIVNQTTAQAVLNKNNYRLTARADQYGSYRGTFSFNQGLIKDKVAIYGAVVYDNREFDRKPSYDLTKRQYGAITLKPFAKTVIRADVENYRNDNRRPNTLTPRDYVTQWNLAGQPYYDPLTRKITLANGTVKGDYVVNALSPYAQQVRDFVRSQPGYNPALRGTSATAFNGTDTNFTFYNGITIFGDAALTTATGFRAGQTPANNMLFVPGITWTNLARTNLQIANGQPVNWFQPIRGQRYRTQFGTATNPAGTADLFPTEAAIWANPASADVYNRGYTSSTGWTGLNNGIVGYKYPGVTDKSIYDWTKVNVNQMNFGQDRNQNYHVELEQELRDDLFLSGGWFRQDFSSVTNYTVAQLNVTTLFVDTNKNLPDGTANPYFGKPYVEDQDPDRYVNNERDDHFRAMLAWTPDFTRKQGWWKWLGHHQVLGLWSRDESMLDQLRQRLAYVDSASNDGKYRYMVNPNNNADGTPTGWSYLGTSGATLRRTFYLASPTDPNGTVTRSSGEWNYSRYAGDIKVYDFATNSFKTVNMTTDFTTWGPNTARTQRLVNSWSAGINAFLWDDRFIGTFGVRRDDFRARVTTNATGSAVTDWDGTVLFPSITAASVYTNGQYNYDALKNRWQKWLRMTGTTRTLGGVLRPFQKWQSIDSRADSGNLFWEFVRDFGISYNKSDNFNPPAGAFGDYSGNALPKPSGEGKDYGFQFALLHNKLFARVNWFSASNQNEQYNASAALQRLQSNMDTTLFRNWARTIAMINMGMDPRVNGFGDNLSQATENSVQAAAEPIWKQAYNYYGSLPFTVQNGTRNAKSKGYEAEVSYNPTPSWTIKATFAKQDTKYFSVLKEFDSWLAIRKPVWENAKAADYLLPQYQNLATYTTAGGRQVDIRNFWSSYGFNTAVTLEDQFGNTNVQNYYNINVIPQAVNARDLEGQSAPEQRKYHGSLITNYGFTQGHLKGFSVGGGERWESKAIIGYYGRASGANGTQLDVSDISRPIYDGGNSYTDLWIAYTRRIHNNKITWKTQLNVSNVFEKGGLQVVSVNYDGSPYGFRIVDPRQFILTTSFEF